MEFLLNAALQLNQQCSATLQFIVQIETFNNGFFFLFQSPLEIKPLTATQMRQFNHDYILQPSNDHEDDQDLMMIVTITTDSNKNMYLLAQLKNVACT